MSASQPATIDVVEEQSVLASLQPGPKGTVRLSYEYPRLDIASYWLKGFALRAPVQYTYASSVIEIDRAKLRRLEFSQEELAEIGFSLVLRLSGLLHRSGGGSDA
jgi:hypothetical protein